MATKYKLNFPDGVPADEPLRKKIIALAEEHGWLALGSEFCRAATEEINVIRRPGRPQLGTERTMHIWLAIELYRYHTKQSVQAAAIQMASKAPHVDVGDKNEFTITQTARRYHTAGQKLMRKNPRLAARWERKLERAKKRRNLKMRVKRRTRDAK